MVVTTWEITVKLIAIVALFVCTSAHAVCFGSYQQCNAETQQYYGQTYQQYEQNQQQQWNRPPLPPQQYQYEPPVNQNGFDRYGHYHTIGY